MPPTKLCNEHCANEAHLILYSCSVFFCTHFLCVRFINTSARRCAYKSCKIYTEQLHTHTHINTHIVRDICASCYFAGHCLRFDNIHSHRLTHRHTHTGADSHINASSLQLRNLRIPWGIVFDYGRQRGSLQEKFLGLGLRGSNGTGVLC